MHAALAAAQNELTGLEILERMQTARQALDVAMREADLALEREARLLLTRLLAVVGGNAAMRAPSAAEVSHHVNALASLSLPAWQLAMERRPSMCFTNAGMTRFPRP